MMKLWKMFTKNHKGFSLVELICAVAILSIVITGAGSAMVISARSYQRGSAELDLQQQAQITANLLTNIIIDSDTIEEPALGTTATQLSVRKIETETVTDAEGNTSQVPVNYRYKIIPDSTNSSLLYTREQVDADGNVVAGTTETNTLAEHIDTTAFSVTCVAENNIDFTLKVLGTDGRTFESDYHVTPRNGVSGSTGSALGGVKSIWVEPELILEPNQIYYLNVRITGTSIQGYTIADLTGNTSSETLVPAPADVGETIGANTVKIKVGRSETGSGTDGMFTFKVVPNDAEIEPVDVRVYVRRVNDITVTGTRTSGSVNKAGGYYKVTASPQGTNMDKKLGAWYDADYVNPYQVSWSYVFVKEDESGNTTYPDYNEYIEIIGQGVERGIVDGAERDVPYVMFKLKQNMTSGCQLTVTATALHPEGVYPAGTDNKTNKMGLRYGKVSDATASVSAEWTLDYQAWRRNGKLDITVPVTDRDYDFYPDGTCLYKYRDDANVHFVGYDINNRVIVDQTFNPWTSSQNSLLDAEVDRAQVDKVWNLVLNVKSNYGDRYYGYSSYSTPYIVAGINDQYGNAENPYSWSDVNISGHSLDAQYRYGYGGFGLTDVVRYVVEVTYGYEDESGNKHVETIIGDYSVENVSIQYRNSLSSNWVRNSVIYVTTDDQITDYKVYFKFDKGWDGKNYYFHDLQRFVGVIYDDEEDDTKDQRRDIAVTQNPVLSTSEHPETDESTYLMFHLSAADKEECKRLSEEYGGVITESFEYNPYLDMLNKAETWNSDEYGNWYIENYTPIYPHYDGVGGSGVTVTHDMMQKMKGCSGIVEFHFVEPNITAGASLKTRYCPTPDEFTALGNIYYVSSSDTEIKIVRNGNNAIYQEVSGGATTTVNLTWNGAGWTAN